MTTLLVTQHYWPDETSTADYLTQIARALAQDDDVTVISGTPNSDHPGGNLEPRVVEIMNWVPPKGALIRRALAMAAFGVNVFACVLRHCKPGTLMVAVTTPFVLPYVAVLAARIRSARTALIVYDLYPDALINARLTADNSIAAWLIRRMNEWLYGALDGIVIIGRDMERHFSQYHAPTAGKLTYIPNWATLPARARPIDPGNPYRSGLRARFVVGLSGNLGFTHDPETVFEAARLLVDELRVHFLLSGWGVGWERLKQLQSNAQLLNVSLIERVPEEQLDDFLAAADAWIIPYRKNMAGISVPSRLYNLLAIGRPIIALSEPEAEHALMLAEHDVGWVVTPEDPAALAETIRRASADPGAAAEKGQRAVSIIGTRLTANAASEAYRNFARQLRANALADRS